MAIGVVIAVCPERGGYADLFEATKRMTKAPTKRYHPDPQISETYNVLYGEYKKLHDHFGRGSNDVMRRLRVLNSDGFDQ